MSTQRNQELSGYVFLKVIECLEQNIRRQIDCKRPSTTKQMNRVQNIRTEICKSKYKQVRLVLAVFNSESPAPTTQILQKLPGET